MADPRPTDAETAAALRASVAGVRAPSAAGPGPAAESLRTAYLDLLKLCLTDLAGTTSVSVGPTPDGTAVARQLTGDQMRLRAVGLDWPLQGASMAGLARLDDLQRCVESVVEEGVAGDLIEAGTWRGGAGILMRATLDTLGEGDRTVWLADSFEGFSADTEGLSADLSHVDFLAVPEQEVRDNFARLGCEHGVRFVPGFFQDTLPGLGDRAWAVVRLDGDTYEATQVALESLYPGLADGGYLIVDDYVVSEECRAAVDDYRDEHGIAEALEPVDWSCVRWRRGRPGAAAAHAPGSAEPIEIDTPSPGLSVPTAREVGLKGAATELRTRLAAAEQEAAEARAEAERVSDSYEGSISWRITRPLRAAARRARELRSPGS